MIEDNFFKYIELVEARDAKSLALLLASFKFKYQLNTVWSDTKGHYALINPGKKLSVRDNFLPGFIKA